MRVLHTARKSSLCSLQLEKACAAMKAQRNQKLRINKQVVLLLLFSCCCVCLFVTPWTAAHQALLSSTISWSLFTVMSTELVMLPNHLILCRPLLFFAFSFSQHQGLFQSAGSSHQVAKALELQIQHQSFQ